MKREYMTNKRGGRVSQKAGRNGQDIARVVMQSLGFTQIEEVATPVITRHTQLGKVVVAYKEKVSCDFVCVDPERYASKVEVKLHNGDSLAHSRLEDHQQAALIAWDCNHLRHSYVVWVRTDRGDDIYRIRRYPWDGKWTHGTSWKWDE